jgi:hypothetical protein
MDSGDAATRASLHAKAREDLLKRQLSNAENFDKAILTLSSAFLGLSLAFLKDLAPYAPSLMVLKWSWAAFIGAIVITLTSYVTSQRAIGKELERCRRYYDEAEDKVYGERNLWGEATDWLNLVAGVLFVAAVISTALFVYETINGVPMASKTVQDRMVPTGDIFKNGAPLPGLQKVPQPSPAPTPTTTSPPAPDKK